VTESTAVDIGAVQPADHPDFVGGIVWSPLELRWINERLDALRRALTTSEKQRHDALATLLNDTLPPDTAARMAIAILAKGETK
jgi:hypothetical protein